MLLDKVHIADLRYVMCYTVTINVHTSLIRLCVSWYLGLLLVHPSMLSGEDRILSSVMSQSWNMD